MGLLRRLVRAAAGLATHHRRSAATRRLARRSSRNLRAHFSCSLHARRAVRLPIHRVHQCPGRRGLHPQHTCGRGALGEEQRGGHAKPPLPMAVAPYRETQRPLSFHQRSMGTPGPCTGAVKTSTTPPSLHHAAAVRASLVMAFSTRYQRMPQHTLSCGKRCSRAYARRKEFARTRRFPPSRLRRP